ncbi:efflux RND transporter periplasmic adaptor subunit [Brevundimonas subvibrioides]|uniref:Efflux transporter, RND family, MFP subunit n=1 Tax=Brevundimonas subvibrioides (strain ATCC 15264 / DSM 4735 / LMG 14903 / NBRC 16000 / CB 81) TaxID=633149 RepID=D9QMI4_BRESC|nr:efflux RND transporter periplasmic adaptor subunit [Brevundimonas subvibrioides]ADL00154.1 efflux transporter, RND family, MFP subunit [Brevundimonas subvibrioides ATCC 15264]
MAATPSTHRLLRVPAMAAALGLTLLTAACGGSEGQEAEAPNAVGQAVTAVTVSSSDLPRTINASGTVAAWEEVPVGAETGGLVATAVYVDEGQYVRQGQALVQLNDSLLRAQLRQQQAAVQTAQANLARDEAALSRAQELKERGFLSQASLDTALANQRAASANLASAQASLSETQTRVNQATIRAPVSGLISSRSVTRGQIVAAGTELFRLVRDGRLELNAEVPEAELALVRAGMSATIISDQAGQASGTVRIVTPQVDPETRLGIARVALTGGTALQPGMFARTEINAGTQPSLTVPAAAVVFRENRAGVYVVGTDSTVRFVQITEGGRTDGRVAVATGLTAGQRVVVEGAGFLGEGDQVRVVPSIAAQAAATPATQAR